MGPLCNLNEFKNTDNRLVKINKTNLINNFRVPINVKKRKRISRRRLAGQRVMAMFLYIISKPVNINQ